MIFMWIVLPCLLALSLLAILIDEVIWILSWMIALALIVVAFLIPALKDRIEKWAWS